eukprot:TRINITY_DN2351_c0_g1_i1.p1 TRINITY_DN2351_c0_g1~~TRINITY_DN2351_c0_g1_i1.p1  ORF type:complete len:947 (+),score=314.11 TRINITY_DN2351_c0_g1_i1:257-3097(+)
MPEALQPAAHQRPAALDECGAAAASRSEQEILFLRKRIALLERQLMQRGQDDWCGGAPSDSSGSSDSSSPSLPVELWSGGHRARFGTDPIRGDACNWCDPASTLCAYAARGDTATVQRLLGQSQYSVNASDYDGSTPLHVAARHCQLEVAELLVSLEADVNAADSYGSTPLARVHAAPPSQRKDALIALLSKHGGSLRTEAPRRGIPVPGTRIETGAAWGVSDSASYSFDSSSPDFATPPAERRDSSIGNLPSLLLSIDAAPGESVELPPFSGTSHHPTIHEPQPVAGAWTAGDSPSLQAHGEPSDDVLLNTPDKHGPFDSPSAAPSDADSRSHGRHDEDDVTGKKIVVPVAAVDSVTVLDPNSANTLVFRVIDGKMSYSVNGERRAPFKRMLFSPAPPRVWFPCIGTCATLPKNDVQLPQILGGLRYLADSAGVTHDIASVMRVRIDTTHWISDGNSGLVIVMVGLPGRGKTFISKRLCRWLNWKGIAAKIFNVGHYRRKVTARAEKQDQGYFDPGNKRAAAEREKLAEMACDDVKRFIQCSQGGVAIFDATNSSRSRRQKLVHEFGSVLPQNRIIFIESVCTMDDVIEQNILRAKCGNGDYQGRDAQYVLRDFQARIKQYQKVYDPLSEESDSPDAELSWVQLTNISAAHRGGKVVINKVSGHLAHKLIYFLLNMSPISTAMYLATTGETSSDTRAILGGNPDLTARGWKFAAALRRFFNRAEHNHENVQVWTSTMKCAMDTCTYFTRDSSRFRVKQYKTLDEKSAGDFEGMTLEEIRKAHPQMWKRRQADMYNYGWPRGESYHNMNVRLEQIILDMHKAEDPVLVVTHPEVSSGLYAYMAELLPELSVHIEIPRNCVFEFNYQNHDITVTTHDLTAWVDDPALELDKATLEPAAEDYLVSVPKALPPEKAAPHANLPKHIIDAVCMQFTPSGSLQAAGAPLST